MRIWKFALYISLVSLVISVVLSTLPLQYSIFSSTQSGLKAGNLFPLMLLLWTMSLVAFAMNNVFADKCYIDQNFNMHPVLKYLPSVLGVPVFASFFWFAYTWVKSIHLY